LPRHKSIQIGSRFFHGRGRWWWRRGRWCSWGGGGGGGGWGGGGGRWWRRRFLLLFLESAHHHGVGQFEDVLLGLWFGNQIIQDEDILLFFRLLLEPEIHDLRLGLGLELRFGFGFRLGNGFRLGLLGLFLVLRKNLPDGSQDILHGGFLLRVFVAHGARLTRPK
jgi:hypothetical protein